MSEDLACSYLKFHCDDGSTARHQPSCCYRLHLPLLWIRRAEYARELKREPPVNNQEHTPKLLAKEQAALRSQVEARSWLTEVTILSVFRRCVGSDGKVFRRSGPYQVGRVGSFLNGSQVAYEPREIIWPANPRQLFGELSLRARFRLC